jgi:fumarate hydratase class II
MPGKVNPVIPEAVNMVGAHVIGNDATISVAAMNGSLELNVMMPVIAYSLLESIELIGSCSRVFAEKCVTGIEADRERCRSYAERTASLVTALAPVIGYDRAAQIFKDALKQNKPIRTAIVEAGVVPPDEVDALLDLEKLARGNSS